MSIHKLVVACAAMTTVFMSPIYAATVSGTVTDTSGKAVENARVYIKGSNVQVFTNKKGQFSIKNVDEEHVHIHVYSSNHVHGDREYDDVPEELVADFVLRPTQIENILVTASPLASSVLESAVPVSVLDGDALKSKQSPTLGETLSGLPGVHSTYFGPVASSPIIRGTDGPRVKIVQNGLDVSDASRIGPDHNVATETSTATQIEVLRGPATLQYGSGAIGGVVNVVDQRIPTQIPESPTGEAELRFDTVSNEEYAKVDLNAGAGIAAFHIDAFSRETENYEIPGFAESVPDEGEEPGILENSAIDTTGFTLGTSLVGEQGYIGIAYQRLENLYGVPGHHEEEEEPGAGEEPHEEEEEVVRLDVEMDRYQISGEWFSPVSGINSINLRSAYTEYEHVELEGEEIGTVFSNDTVENRLSINHKGIDGWHGVIGLHQTNVEFAAIGEEAFTPRSETDTFALYLVEEKRFGDFIVELGGRIERTEIEVPDSVEVEINEGQASTFDIADQSFTSLSLSTGTVWNYQQGYSLALSLTRSERAPSHQELFSAGAHLSTQTFDVGAIFALDAQGNVSLNEQAEEEISSNIDLTWRKYEGDFGFTLSLFYNQVDDYLFQSSTGFTADGLPVLINLQEDANLYGMETELSYQFNSIFSATVIADVINAELDNPSNSGNENLPRIPPLRIGTSLDFKTSSWSGNIGLNWYDDQDDAAIFETTTEGYTLVDANLNYRITTGPTEWTLFLRGHNLTDEEARPHTSFIKDLAPIPGRGFAFGVRAGF